jgi:hypothetical protein
MTLSTIYIVDKVIDLIKREHCRPNKSSINAAIAC